MGVACDFAVKYVEHARISLRQPWLSSSADRVKPNLPVSTIDKEGRVRTISWGYGPLRLRSTGIRALDTTVNSSLINLVLSDTPIDLAGVFLADARYLGYRDDPDVRIILLLCAIACEIKIKDSLRLLADPSQIELVELLFEKPRDFSLAAHSLFQLALRAISGRSLEVDNIDLYKHVKKLFVDRNRIAHSGGRGAILDPPGRYIGTAESVFGYLDDIVGSAAP